MKKKECAFCGKEIVGHGNNPAPFTNKGEVCDECNYKYVIPARLENTSKKESKKYVIEVRPGEYVKTIKYDTKNLHEAKFFDTEKEARNYVSRYLPHDVNIKLVEDCE